MTTKLRIVLCFVLLVIGIAVGGESVYISTIGSMTRLDSALLNVFLWLISAALGWVLNSIYAEYSATHSLQERAKPAIRRVWELQRSAEQLQLMLATRAIESSVTQQNTSTEFSAEVVAIQMQVGQLRAAVQDWRELLPESYVENVIQKAESEEWPNALPWTQFHHFIKEISTQVDRSDAYGGFRPDIIVGVYPEGGIVGYLMWLALGRRCQLVLMPDAELNPQDKMLSLLSDTIAYHANGRSRVRILIVDASIKSGRTMNSTVTAVQEACGLANVTAELASACVIDYPIPGPRETTPRYIGITGHFHLPFAES